MCGCGTAAAEASAAAAVASAASSMSCLRPPYASRVVAEMVGTLPRGGSKACVPVYAPLPPLPKSLRDMPNEALPKHAKVEVEVSNKTAFVVRGVISAEEADDIVQMTEAMGYTDAAPGINTPPGMRMNEAVHWVDDGTITNAIWSRVKPHVPAEVNGAPVVGLSRRFNHYKYVQGCAFHWHTDGCWPAYELGDDGKMVEVRGDESRFSMLLYLNGPSDGYEGGDTELASDEGDVVSVTPHKGDALFFRHGFGPDSVLHRGTPVTKAVVPKYVARINVMYRGRDVRRF